MTIPNPDAMNTLPFLANIAVAVGVPAMKWDAPGIILLKLLAIVFLVLLNGFFVASEFAIVKVRASQARCASRPERWVRPASSVRHQPLRGPIYRNNIELDICSGCLSHPERPGRSVCSSCTSFPGGGPPWHWRNDNAQR
jgi:hypothetical protein